MGILICCCVTIVKAGETMELSVAGYKVFTVERTPKESLPQERVVIRRSGKAKPLWVSDWGHSTTVAAYTRSGVEVESSKPDVCGDGATKLYIWVYQDTQDFVASLNVLKLGTNVESLVLIPDSPGEGPKIEQEENGRGVVISAQQFVPFVEGRSTDVPTPTLYLRWNHGAFLVATNLMHKLAPTASEQTAHARQLRELFARPPPEEKNANGEPWELWVDAADLAWSGNEPAALNLIEQVWPFGGKDLKAREAEFLKALRSSRWYQEMNPAKAALVR